MAENPLQLLFSGELVVANLGLASFGENLQREATRVVQVDWRPEAGGDDRLLRLLDRVVGPDGQLLPRVAEANREAVDHLLAAQPVVLDIDRAETVVPGMHERLVLHAGPPISWERMCGPLRGAVIGGLIYEGLASTPDEAAALAASGDIEFAPCHHHQAVGPMAGVVTASMPVWIVENQAFGNRAFCTLNEGLGKVLRYGAYDDEVLDRLHWLAQVAAPQLRSALERHGPLDLRSLLAQALQMGDEGHNRNRAGTSLVIRCLAPFLAHSSFAGDQVAELFRFLDRNDHFFLNLSMPACKCALDPAAGFEGSSLVTTMARNGTDFGIRISALPDRWFTAPAPMVEGLYLPGFTATDAAPDIGDSVITETAGIGGFAMAAAPAIVQFVGGSAEQALQFTRRMYDITLAESPYYKVPALDFRGTPTGIDLIRVVATGIVPVVNTGIAHREPGVGMVGAGLVEPPLRCFQDAFTAFMKKLESLGPETETD
ncbi:MAG: DUF1116 domain-containing protein [bacterium]